MYLLLNSALYRLHKYQFQISNIFRSFATQSMGHKYWRKNKIKHSIRSASNTEYGCIRSTHMHIAYTVRNTPKYRFWCIRCVGAVALTFYYFICRRCTHENPDNNNNNKSKKNDRAALNAHIHHIFNIFEIVFINFMLQFICGISQYCCQRGLCPVQPAEWQKSWAPNLPSELETRPLKKLTMKMVVVVAVGDLHRLRLEP